MRIYLIGMPGSGKSTLGVSLAQKLSYTFMDLDEKIVEKEGMPVSEVFNQKGEQYFRETESAVLRETIHLDNVVVATGGGAPCFFDNLEWMNKNGVSLFLQVPLNLIMERVYAHPHQQNVRPLFAGKTKKELMETLEAMWQKRGIYYQRASITIPVEEAKAEKVIKRIKEFSLN